MEVISDWSIIGALYSDKAGMAQVRQVKVAEQMQVKSREVGEPLQLQELFYKLEVSFQTGRRWTHQVPLFQSSDRGLRPLTFGVRLRGCGVEVSPISKPLLQHTCSQAKQSWGIKQSKTFKATIYDRSGAGKAKEIKSSSSKASISRT